MKINAIINCVLVLVIAATFSSCKEDEDKAAEAKAKLTNVNEWKLVSLKVGTSDVPVEPCVGDNVFRFDPNNEYTMDEGATKCDPADPQTMTGEWSLTSNGEGLVITVDGATKITVIDELTSTILKIHYEIGPLAYVEIYEPK